MNEYDFALHLKLASTQTDPSIWLSLTPTSGATRQELAQVIMGSN